MEPPTTVAVVEDEAEARRRLTDSIQAQPGLSLAGEWSTGGELWNTCYVTARR